MSIDSTWLRCPNCFHDLSPVDERTLGCDSGHRFDRSKYGYVTLLPPKAPRTIGDDPAMLRARAELLGSGAYSPISDAIIDVVRGAAATSAAPDDALRIADLGCGTGHYSAELATAFPSGEFLLADRSPDAVRASLRTLPSATGVVLDIWRPLPVRDRSVDVILNVFAPRNLEEFARVLHPDGVIVTVVPTERHLAELRRDGLVLDIPSGKSDRLVDQFAELEFAVRERRVVEYRLDAGEATRLRIAEMGPSAHHRPDDDGAASGTEVAPAGSSAPDVEPVTISVDVLVFARTLAAG
ncbi:methyltransferase domain-containing protein [Agromyces sp. NPDC058136]|uniref:methyltransferase domain-containing protein n=1 Tax=Agromyces sp. NPDC058136 TaxID=3346354 RepID=UPI0036DCC9F0